MNVLKRINKLRLERNWSIYRLSVESGVSQSTLTNMFNRETLPSITTLECICSAFGMTMSEFFAEPQEAAPNSEAQELAMLYNALSEKERESILVLLRSLARKG